MTADSEIEQDTGHGSELGNGHGIEHVDVLIVGAGISGIGAACHLQEQRPGTTFAIVDALDSFGGTWWTHRYPGVRSDSDLFTFGYRFKPWLGTPIATSDEILRYLGEVIDEHELKPLIRYQHRVDSAEWSSDEQRWTVHMTRTDPLTGAGTDVMMTTGFVWMCQGYYRHNTGYTPEWPGFDRFAGEVLHPQEWPADVDLAGKRVVVIGSGATAATLIPNIADDCAHVTMLQRSPTFFFVRPNSNELADTLRDLDIPDEWTHEIVRRKILKDQDAITKMSFEAPETLRAFLVDTIRPLVPEGFDIDTHFNPTYRPWQQRIAMVPDGDFFKAINSGQASVVTDQIEEFTADGIRLASGEVLPADVVITATGFDLSVMGDVSFAVDGRAVDWHDTVTYRGIMFTGVPNMAYVFGYFRASWTLRADLISDFVCRVLDHLDELGAATVTPVAPAGLTDLRDWVEPDNFNPGYLARSMHKMPRQGPAGPWRIEHDYLVERESLPAADLDDGALVFTAG
ncbi:MAG: NAD(P)/FAD-dependent oxidoreductase [Ilumatobacteraceae bacterium]